MCINLHDEDSNVTSLGMIRNKGTPPAKKAVELTYKKLDEFGLSIQKHLRRCQRWREHNEKGWMIAWKRASDLSRSWPLSVCV